MEKEKQSVSSREEVQRLLRAQSQAEEQQTTPDHMADESHRHTDTAADKAHHITEQGRQKANQVADRVHEAVERSHADAKSGVEHARAKAHEADSKQQHKLDDVKAKAQEKTAQVQEKVQRTGTRMHDNTDAAMTASGERLSNLSQTMRERAPAGKAGEAAHRGADALEQSGSYLQRSNPDDVRLDMEGLIRKNPLESLLVGMGAGFLLAQMTRRR